MIELLPHRVRRWSHGTTLLGCGVLALLLPLSIDWLWPTLLEPVELRTIDLRYRFRPAIPVGPLPAQAKSDAVVSIDYDDRAGRQLGLGRWPWDRHVHAQVIEWLRQGGARAVMMDLLFDYPARDPEEDRALMAATREAGNVFYPLSLLTEPALSTRGLPVESASPFLLRADIPAGFAPPSALDVVLPLPGLVEGAAGLGHIQRTVDRDGTLRRLPLLYRVPGGLLPALSLAAVFRQLSVNPATIKIEPRQDGHPDAGWVLRFTPRPGDDVLIPMDAEGRAWVNFAGPWGKRFVHFPYSWLVEQMAAPDGTSRLPAWFEGKTAVVANLTTGAGDRGPTPFEQDFVFGELHLHVLNMVLTRQFLRDATTRESVLITAVPLVLLTVVALIGGPSLILSCFAVIFGGLLFTLQRGFHAGVVLPAVHPMLSLTMGLVFLLTARFVIVDGERRRFLSILGACLPPQTIRQIKQHPNRIAALLAGRRRELTVLFADIRGFSTYCTRVDPAEVQDILHDYLTAMTIVIRSHGGTLDKYMGDGVMAFFGDADPEGGGSHAQEERVARQAANAVRAGIVMQREMSVLNGRWAAKGRDPHHIRIGINTGPMTVGNLGTEYLWDYTVVGSEVNKAQRLEGAAEPGGILLAERTYTLARKKHVIPHDLAAQSFVLKGLGTDSSLYVLAPDLVARLATPTP